MMRAMLVAAVLVCAAPAQAIYLADQGGGVALLRGALDKGDGDVFRKFIESPRAQPIKLLYLESNGGEIGAGISIGEQVRKLKLATAVKAETTICYSSCTLIFAGGVRRYNIGGDKVWPGLGGLSGLGYHPANIRGDRIRVSIKSEKGTELMNKFYVAMGQPGAANLSRSAAFDTLFHPSGKQTLDLKIATSLSAPAE